MTVAEAHGVVKRYGRRVALAGVDLRLAAGEVLALLGPNGAGKSTLVGILTGLRRADAGEVRVFGLDPRLPGARTRIGVALQESAFPTTLRVDELVDLVAAHFAAPVPRRELLERFELAPLARRQAGGLSGGQRRRLAVALAFVGRPRVLFLDEPGGDLDPAARRMLWEVVRDFARSGGAVLLTTHHLDEAEALASRVAVIRQGAIVADDSLAGIRGRAGRLRVRLPARPLPPLASAVRVQRAADHVVITTHDAVRLFEELATHGVPTDGLEVTSVRLEEAFLDLVDGEGAP